MGKQEKFESLIDPEDVAAGNQTKMRWRDENSWIIPNHKSHESLVDDEFFTAVQKQDQKPQQAKRHSGDARETRLRSVKLAVLRSVRPTDASRPPQIATPEWPRLEYVPMHPRLLGVTPRGRPTSFAVIGGITR